MVDLGNPTDPEMPELCDTSDDEAPPRPPGSSADGIGVSSERSGTLPHTHRDSSPRRFNSSERWVVPVDGLCTCRKRRDS